MATDTLTLTIRWRWWVAPYVCLVKAFLFSVAWALDEDDERIEAWIGRQAEFVISRGLVCDVTGHADHRLD